MTEQTHMIQNLRLYPWHQLFHNLVFWQATWFLYFQQSLTAPQAILLYVVYDISVTALEVPSGYMSDRIGRRFTLIASALAYTIGLLLLGLGGSFLQLAVAQVMVGAAAAFKSGTDTSLLYQSLHALEREDEMETHTLRAWRFGFIGLGVSAITGGAIALWSPSLPFFLSALSMVAALWCAWRFCEPSADVPVTERARIKALIRHFRRPAILWLFLLGMLMYGFSHIPFVFGQPFIVETLDARGFSTEAPLVSGTVTALMMGLSVLVSLIAPTMRKAMGLGALLLLAFGLQVGLAAMLSAFGSVAAIALLILRMVPDSLSTPFIAAHLQPMLGDETRATFLSLKSFFGRLLFAASLGAAAGATSAVDQMPLADIQAILAWYALAGVIAMVVFALSLRRAKIGS